MKLSRPLVLPFKAFERAYAIAFDYSFVFLKEINAYLTKGRISKFVHLDQLKRKRRFLVILIALFSLLFIPLALIRLVFLDFKRFFINKLKVESVNRIRFDSAGKIIVFFAPINWNFRHQRPQNLAESLAKCGNNVVYVNPTIEYGRVNKDTLEYTLVSGVWVCTIKSQVRRKSTYIGVEGFPTKMAEGIARLMEDFLGKKFYSSALLVVQQPSWWPLIERLQGNQLLFDCMDLHSDFKLIDPKNVLHERNLDISCDNIVVTSDFLREDKSVIGNSSKSVAVIRNGVSSSRFACNPIPDSEMVVGYFGALAEWFDIDLVKYLVEAKPEVHFQFIGLVSNPSIVLQLESYSNVSFLGEVPHSELPERVKVWSAGLIPFKLSPLILATNPVKMYEYASMGIPTIATKIPEVELVSKEVKGVYVSNSYDEFRQKLDLALDFTVYDREHLSAWSKNHDWSKRAQELINYANVVPRVSIVVLMWNQGLMTVKCLQSIIQRSDYPNLEIILVDNDSKVAESTLVTHWIENQSNQNIRYIRNSTNLGFAGGNNVGLRQATGDYLVVLNNDTEVSPGWIWRSLKHFYRNPNLGILGPSTNNCGNEGRVKLHVAEHDWLSEVVPRFNFRVPHLIQANTVAFFCAFIPRKALEEIGLISEDYGRGYFEDDDYCRRTQAAGYEIGIARDVFVYHKMGASFSLMEDSEKSELFYANKAKYEAKWGLWEPHTFAFDADQA